MFAKILKGAVACAALGAPLALAAPAAAGQAAASACQMVMVGELKIVLNGNQPTIPGEINGQKVSFLIDTGSANNILLRAHAERLGVAGVQLDGVRMSGVGGGSAVNNTVIKDLKIGAIAVQDAYMLVAGEAQNIGREDIVGVIGASLFSRFDVEFDLAGGAIRMFQPKNCKNDSLAYWGGDYTVAPMQGSPTVYPEYKVEVKLNGRKMTALLDTGATTSIATKDAAYRAGVKTNAPEVQTHGQSGGFGKETVDVWVATFDSFSVGEEVIQNAKIRIADLFGANAEVETGSRVARRMDDTPGMLLGADFFRAHRVLIANSQKKAYISYKGGPVFQTWSAPTATPASASVPAQ